MGYSAFPKAPALLESHHQIFSCHIQETRCGDDNPSAEIQSVYSEAPANWAGKCPACRQLVMNLIITECSKTSNFVLNMAKLTKCLLTCLGSIMAYQLSMFI